MSKISSGKAPINRSKSYGIFAVITAMLGILFIANTNVVAEENGAQLITVTRTIQNNAFKEDGFSPVGSGYQAGDELEVVLEISADEEITLDEFSIRETLPAGWSLSDNDGNQFTLSGSYAVPKGKVDMTEWDLSAEPMLLKYFVIAGDADYIDNYPVGSFSYLIDEVASGWIAINPIQLSGHAITAADDEEMDITVLREGDLVTLTALEDGELEASSEYSILWLNADDEVIGTGNPLEEYPLTASTEVKTVKIYKVTLTNCEESSFAEKNLIPVGDDFYAKENDVISLNLLVPEDKHFKEWSGAEVQPTNDAENDWYEFTMPAEAVEVEAVCEEKYTITFKVDGIEEPLFEEEYFAGHNLADCEVSFDNPIVEVLAGYNIDPPELADISEQITWSSSGNKFIFSFYMPDGDVTITPVFQGVTVLRKLAEHVYDDADAANTGVKYLLSIPNKLLENEIAINIVDTLPPNWEQPLAGPFADAKEYIDFPYNTIQKLTFAMKFDADGMLEGANQFKDVSKIYASDEKDGFTVYELTWLLVAVDSSAFEKTWIGWDAAEVNWIVEQDDTSYSGLGDVSAILHASGVYAEFINVTPTDEEQYISFGETEFYQKNDFLVENEDAIITTKINPEYGVKITVDENAGYFTGKFLFTLYGTDEEVEVVVRVDGENLEGPFAIEWDEELGLDLMELTVDGDGYSFVMPKYSITVEALCDDSVVAVKIEGELAKDENDKDKVWVDTGVTLYDDFAPEFYYVAKGEKLYLQYQIEEYDEEDLATWSGKKRLGAIKVSVYGNDDIEADDKKEGVASFEIPAEVGNETIVVNPVYEYPLVIGYFAEGSHAHNYIGTWTKEDYETEVDPLVRTLRQQQRGDGTFAFFTGWEHNGQAGFILENLDGEPIALDDDELQNFVMPGYSLEVNAIMEVRAKLSFEGNYTVEVDGEPFASFDGGWIPVGAEVIVTFNGEDIWAFEGWILPELPGDFVFTLDGEELDESALAENPLVFDMPKCTVDGIEATYKGLTAKRSFWSLEGKQLFSYTYEEEIQVQIIIENETLELDNPIEVNRLELNDIIPKAWKADIDYVEARDGNDDIIGVALIGSLLDDSMVTLQYSGEENGEENGEKNLVFPITFVYRVTPKLPDEPDEPSDDLAEWGEASELSWGADLSGKADIEGSIALRSYELRYDKNIIAEMDSDVVFVHESDDENYVYLTIMDTEAEEDIRFIRIVNGTYFEGYTINDVKVIAGEHTGSSEEMLWLDIPCGYEFDGDTTISGSFDPTFFLLTYEDGRVRSRNSASIFKYRDQRTILYVKEEAEFRYIPRRLYGSGIANQDWRVNRVVMSNNALEVEPDGGITILSLADAGVDLTDIDFNENSWRFPYSVTVTMPSYSANLETVYAWSVNLEDGISFVDGREDKFFEEDQTVEIALPLYPFGVDADVTGAPDDIEWDNNVGSFEMPDESITIALEFSDPDFIEAIVKSPVDDEHWNIFGVTTGIDGVILSAELTEDYYYLKSWVVVFYTKGEEDEEGNFELIRNEITVQADGSLELNLSEVLEDTDLYFDIDEKVYIEVSAKFLWPTVTREFKAKKYTVGDNLQVALTFNKPEEYAEITKITLIETLPSEFGQWFVVGGSVKLLDGKPDPETLAIEVDGQADSGVLSFTANVEGAVYPLTCLYTVRPVEATGVQTWEKEDCTVVWTIEDNETELVKEIEGEFQISDVSLTVIPPLVVWDDLENVIEFPVFAVGEVVTVFAPTYVDDNGVFEKINVELSDLDCELELDLDEIDEKYVYTFEMPSCDVTLEANYLPAAPINLYEDYEVVIEEPAEGEELNYLTDKLGEDRYYKEGWDVTLKAEYILEDEEGNPSERLVSLIIRRSNVEDGEEAEIVDELFVNVDDIDEAGFFSNSFTMPTPVFAVDVIANYTQLFKLTVTDGYIGEEPAEGETAVTEGFYAAGDEVLVTSDSPYDLENAMAFIGWKAAEGYEEELEFADDAREPATLIMPASNLDIEARFAGITATRSFEPTYFTADEWLTVKIDVNMPEYLDIFEIAGGDAKFTLKIEDVYPSDWDAELPRLLNGKDALFGKQASTKLLGGIDDQYKVILTWEFTASDSVSFDPEDFTFAYQVKVPADIQRGIFNFGEGYINGERITGKKQIAHFSIIPLDDDMTVGEFEEVDYQYGTIWDPRTERRYKSSITHSKPDDTRNAKFLRYQELDGELELVNTFEGVSGNPVNVFFKHTVLSGEYFYKAVYEYPVRVYTFLDDVEVQVGDDNWVYEGEEATIETVIAPWVYDSKNYKFLSWTGDFDESAVEGNKYTITEMPNNAVKLYADYQEAVKVMFKYAPERYTFETDLDATWEVEGAFVAINTERPGFVFDNASVGEIELEIFEGEFELSEELFAAADPDTGELEVILTYQGLEVKREFNVTAWDRNGDGEAVEVTLRISRPEGLTGITALELTEVLPQHWFIDELGENISIEGLNANVRPPIISGGTSTLKFEFEVNVDGEDLDDWSSEEITVTYSARPDRSKVDENLAIWGVDSFVEWAVGDSDDFFKTEVKEDTFLPFRWEIVVNSGEFDIENDGATQKVVAWPNEVDGQNQFVEWSWDSDEDLPIANIDNEISFVLDRDIELTAIFDYYIELEGAFEGKINDVVADTELASEGDEITISTAAVFTDDGQDYKFTGWTFTGLEIEDPEDAEVEFFMPAAYVLAKANYAPAYPYEDVLYAEGETVKGTITLDDDTSILAELSFADFELDISLEQLEDTFGFEYSFEMPTGGLGGLGENDLVSVYAYKVNAEGGSELVAFNEEDEIEETDQLYYLEDASVSVKAVIDIIEEDEEGEVTYRRLSGWEINGELLEDADVVEITIDEGQEAEEGEEAESDFVTYSVLSFAMPAEAVTVEPIYEQAYTITVDGEFYALALEEEEVILTVAEREGWTFDGWTGTYTDENDEVVDLEINIDEDVYSFVMPAAEVTVDSSYTINQYEIIVSDAKLFVVVDEEKVEVEAEDGSYWIDYGTEVVVEADARRGYDFAGWEIVGLEEVDLENSSLEFTVPAVDEVITIEATYTPQYFDISVVDELGELTVEITAEPAANDEGQFAYDSLVNISITVPVGYSFNSLTITEPEELELEFAEVAEGLLQASFDMLYIDDVKIVAAYKAKQYAVTVENASLETGDNVVEDGDGYLARYKSEVIATAVAPSALEEFVAWTILDDDGAELAFENVDDNAEVITFTMPATDVEVSAEFEQVYFSVSFAGEYADKGEVTAAGDSIEDDGVNYYKKDSEVSIGAAEVTGHNFTGWNVLEGDVELVDNSFSMPAENVILEAAYERASYTISFLDDISAARDVTGASADSFLYQDSVTITADVPTGYKFVRWDVSVGNIELVDSASVTFDMPAENLELEAIVEIVYFPVSFVDHSGTAEGEKLVLDGVDTFQYGSEVSITANVPAGFKFVEWIVESGDVELADATSADTSFTMPAEAVVLEARFRDPTPWYPVLTLDIEDDTAERSVRIVKNADLESRTLAEDLVLELDIIGNTVYPVDYVLAESAGLLNGSYRLISDADETSIDFVVNYEAPEEADIVEIASDGNNFEFSAAINLASYFTVTVLRDDGSVYRDYDEVFNYFGFDDADERLISETAYFDLGIYSKGTFIVLVKGYNPEAFAASETTFDIEIESVPEYDAEAWLQDENYSPDFGKVFMLEESPVKAVDFEWPALENASQYVLVIIKDNKAYESINLDGDTTEARVELPAASYSWMIKASNGEGTFTSATQIFQIVDGTVKPVVNNVETAGDNTVTLKLAAPFIGEVEYQIMHFVSATGQLGAGFRTKSFLNPEGEIVISTGLDGVVAGDILLIRTYVNGKLIDDEFTIYEVKSSSDIVQ